MTAKNNYAFTVRRGAAYDDITVTDRRTGKAERYDRAAVAQYDKASGKRWRESDERKLVELVSDAYIEDRGIQRAERSDKRQRDQKHKQRRQRREG